MNRVILHRLISLVVVVCILGYTGLSTNSLATVHLPNDVVLADVGEPIQPDVHDLDHFCHATAHLLAMVPASQAMSRSPCPAPEHSVRRLVLSYKPGSPYKPPKSPQA